MRLTSSRRFTASFLFSFLCHFFFFSFSYLHACWRRQHWEVSGEAVQRPLCGFIIGSGRFKADSRGAQNRQVECYCSSFSLRANFFYTLTSHWVAEEVLRRSSLKGVEPLTTSFMLASGTLWSILWITSVVKQCSTSSQRTYDMAGKKQSHATVPLLILVHCYYPWKTSVMGGYKNGFAMCTAST